MICYRIGGLKDDVDGEFEDIKAEVPFEYGSRFPYL